ncbi:MAG: NAD(P)/FAD-dependent oxidoreductase [Candidatus Helarchaeota archaeon]|nr:NAD(P)/FAD-dependent oxidoreductase [Candidatus Helarchaeota archaeon]
MVDYDVIIVGAGPGGSIAAKGLVEEGLNVLLLEEHNNIGLPQHCSGWISGCEYTEELIKTIPQNLIIQKVKGWRVWSPKGKKICEFEDFGFGGYFVDRVNFDRELAKQAAKKGAKIKVSSKVADLLIDHNLVKGVTINTKSGPENITADVLIGADGVRSYLSGVAKKSGIAELERKPREFFPAMQIEFVNISDIDPGIIEIFFGFDFDKNFGMAFLSPLEENLALIGFGNYKDYLKIKENHPVMSNRLKSADEIRYLGGMYCSKFGESLRTAVKNNVTLIGDAAGYHGIVPACISAHYASGVIKEAIDLEDFQHLELYDKTRKKSTIRGARLAIDIRALTDEKIENFLQVGGKEATYVMLELISKLKI